MASLINRIQRAFLGSAGPEKVRALLIELAIPADGSGENALREARRGFLRPISDVAILRNALGSLGLTGGGTGTRPLNRMRSAILHNLVDSETTLRDGLNDLLEAGDLAGGGGGDTPEWLPEGAVAHINFTTDPPRVYADGQEISTLTTVFGDSALLGVTYAPESIVAGTGLTNTLALIGPFVDHLLDDWTILFEYTDALHFEMTETTFSTDVVIIHNGSVGLSDQNSTLRPDGGGAGADGNHKMALTLTAATAYGSINDTNLFAFGDPGSGTTIEPVMPATATDFVLGSAVGPLKRFTIYNPIKNEAATKALTA